MSYGRDRMNAIKASEPQHMTAEELLEAATDKPFTILAASDFEKLLSRDVKITRQLTKLEQREVVKSVLIEHNILIDKDGELMLNKRIDAGMKSVLDVILKNVGGRLTIREVSLRIPCHICGRADCYFSTNETRLVVEFF